MLTGYARVFQVAALKAAGCDASIVRRPPADARTAQNFTGCWINFARETCSWVWKLDRLSRSLGDVLTIMERLADSNAPCSKSEPKAGLDAARQEGRVGGRRPKLSPQQAEIKKMVSKGRADSQT
jgi:hypothetical protein